MKKILIVEDTEMNRDLLVQLLEDNYELAEAVNGREGLEKAASEKPDLILLDIGLPEMDGSEVSAKLKEDDQLKGIPVIAVTAHAQGFDGYLPKPIDEDELWATAAQLIG